MIGYQAREINEIQNVIKNWHNYHSQLSHNYYFHHNEQPVFLQTFQYNSLGVIQNVTRLGGRRVGQNDDIGEEDLGQKVMSLVKIYHFKNRLID